MIISHSRKFVFIHVVKTGGTSIANALCPLLAEEDILSGYPAQNPAWPKHSWAMHVLDRIDNDYFSFGFVRNPWDRLLSNFFWWQQVDKTGWDTRRYDRFVKGKTFNEYIMKGEWLVKSPCCHFLYQDKEPIVNFVGRFENLQDDFSKLCEKLGVTIDLGHANRSKHGDYRSYYSDEAAALVGDRFKLDIELFGYKF